MNKKGFSLIELLAVIAIIAVVATIGIFSSIAIKKKMNKKMFESTLTEIVASATTFANDNKETFDESTLNQLINSQNKRILGITLKDLRDSKYEKGNDDTYLQYETKESINPLSIIIYEETNAGRMKACIEDSEDNRMLIGDNEAHDEYGSLNIYCSKKAAFGGFTNILVIVDNENNWTKSKTMQIKISNESVNLSGYKIVESQAECKNDDNWLNITGKTVTKTYNVNDELDASGKMYYVCAKDSIGSINRVGKIIKMIDHTNPTCGTVSGASTTWSNTDRTIKVGCNDSGSGCTNTNISKVFSTDTTTSEIELSDLAGNKTNCSVDVYVDKTKPTATLSVSSTNSNYNTNIVNIGITGTDNLSGVTKYCYTTTNSSSGCSWKDQNSFSNIATNKTYTNGENVTYYAFVKDAAGNISPAVSNAYSVYKSCTTKTETGRSAWSACSKSCGTGSQSQTINYKDTYLGTSCPSTTSTQNCNTQGCCSSVTYKDGTTCSASCGGGTYNRLAYSTYDNSRCSSYDKTSGGAKCNTQSCCSTSYTDYINANRWVKGNKVTLDGATYYECSQVKITYCQPTCNGDNRKCNNGSYYANNLYTSKPSDCVDYCAYLKSHATFNTWGDIYSRKYLVNYTTLQPSDNSHVCTHYNCKPGMYATSYYALCDSGCLGHVGWTPEQFNKEYNCSLSAHKKCKCPCVDCK